MDLATFQSIEEEFRMMNTLYWLEKTRGRDGYIGFNKLYSHGWVSPNNFIYAIIQEPDGMRLSKHLDEEGTKKHDPSFLWTYTLILSARCVRAVLDTLEVFYQEYGQTCVGIIPEHIRIRPHLQTGFLT